MDELSRAQLPIETMELADELLRRLRLEAAHGRVELEFERGCRIVKIWMHLPYSRSELIRFDPG